MSAPVKMRSEGDIISFAESRDSLLALVAEYHSYNCSHGNRYVVKIKPAKKARHGKWIRLNFKLGRHVLTFRLNHISLKKTV